MSTRVVAVALPLPVQQAFSYRVPEALPLPERGARVLVPFAGPTRDRRRHRNGRSGREAEGRRRRSRRDAAGRAAAARPGRLDGRPLPGAAGRVLSAAASARGRAGEPGRGAARGTAARRPSPIPWSRRCGPGRCRVSTLVRRLGRDPSARLARLRDAGLVAIEQQLSSPGFRAGAAGRAQAGAAVACAARPRPRWWRACAGRRPTARGRADPRQSVAARRGDAARGPRHRRPRGRARRAQARDPRRARRAAA